MNSGDPFFCFLFFFNFLMAHSRLYYSTVAESQLVVFLSSLCGHDVRPTLHFPAVKCQILNNMMSA